MLFLDETVMLELLNKSNMYLVHSEDLPKTYELSWNSTAVVVIGCLHLVRLGFSSIERQCIPNENQTENINLW